MRRFYMWILVSSLAGAGFATGVALRQDREIERLRAAGARLTERRAALEAKLVAPRGTRPAEARTTEPAAMASRECRPAAAATTAAVRPPAVASGAPTPRAAMLLDPLVSDPILQNLFLAAERANLDALYTPLYRRLGLSTAQIEALRDLLMRREEQRMDLADVQQSHELDGGDAALAALREKAAADFDTRLVGLIGQPAYLQFNDYERTLPVLRMVNQFAGAAGLEGQPLTAPQAEALTRVLAEASPPYAAGGTADPNRVNWPAALGGAEKVLSGDQQRSFLNMVPRYPVDPGAGQPGESNPVAPDGPTGG